MGKDICGKWVPPEEGGPGNCTKGRRHMTGCRVDHPPTCDGTHSANFAKFGWSLDYDPAEVGWMLITTDGGVAVGMAVGIVHCPKCGGRLEAPDA